MCCLFGINNNSKTFSIYSKPLNAALKLTYSQCRIKVFRGHRLNIIMGPYPLLPSRQHLPPLEVRVIIHPGKCEIAYALR